MLSLRSFAVPALAMLVALGCGVNSKSVDNATDAPLTTSVGTPNDPTTSATADNATTLPASAPANGGAEPPAGAKMADPATILARPQVPVLCYHQVREWRAKDSKSAKDYICPTSVFGAHMQMLKDSGYTSISPDQLYNYLAYGTELPAKPVLITFDDGDLDQYETATPILEKLGFKAMYNIMTVAIGRRGKQPYMDKTQIKDLADRGHTIGCHTWDHHNVKKYQGDDWKTQIDEPTAKLEAITGKPIRHFAYPFGLWNHEAAEQLTQRNYRLAFQLAERKRDERYPLMSVRRIIASGYWSPRTLHNNMVGSFR